MRLRAWFASFGGTLAVVAALTVMLAAGSSGATTRAPIQIKVLSTRADLVSGGEALVQVVLPPHTQASSVKAPRWHPKRLTRLRDAAKRQVRGPRDGPGEGSNVADRDAHGTAPALAWTIVNHPIGGPIFSGPQIQPWLCQAGAKDKQCDQPPAFAYYYLPAGTSSTGAGASGIASESPFQSYDPNSPPPSAAIATTTTTDGVTVPFIIREETGYIDRDQYAIATLWQPGKPWEPWAPQRQYNGRLVITHGASCDTTYGTGTAPTVQDAKILGGGFIVMSTALDNAGHNCNLLTQAESLVMTKEWVIDHYGEIRWTIGSGSPVARSCSSRWPTPIRASIRGSRRSAASPTRGPRRWSTRITTCS